MPKLQVLIDDSAEAGSSGTLGGTLSRPGLAGRVKALDTSVLKESASALVTELSSVFASLKEVGDFNLKEVTVSISVNAEGGLVLVGKAGVTGGISLTFEP